MLFNYFCTFEQVINKTMRKLTSAEFDQLPLKGKGRSSQVFNSIINLKEGEGLLIERKDWTRKAGPSTLVRYIEKKHHLRLFCATLEGGKGWAIKRIPSSPSKNVTEKKISQPKASKKQDVKSDNLELKSELILFYLSRIAVHKIERIEDTQKAAIIHFWKEDNKLIQEFLSEIIKTLKEQGHIVIEGDKTYIPLRNSKI